MPLSQIDSQYLSELRDSTQLTLRAAIGDASDVAILDAPNQTNVGDSLIWAGELAYLRRMGLRLRYVADIKTFDAGRLRRVMPRGVVLLHGGGNFGDLWVGHQMHREKVVRELPDYRIVQLPQSVYFKSKERAETANSILGQHPDFHLLLRDPLSLERAAELLPALSTEFCYDMALGYQPPEPPHPPRPKSILIIAREDREAASGLSSVTQDWIQGAEITSTDWHSEGWLATKYRLARACMHLQRTLARANRKLRVTPVLPQVIERSLIKSLNQINIDGALKWYASASIVVVDRLHAHVLALLLGLDHVALDNNYRKIGAVFDLYTGKFSTARYATDTDTARHIVQTWVGR
ncbi:polysaccharide pyruvyl transferase family protein [Herbiconiux sp. A18JL235]|uniref:Polysaccharide pyruvyl transferase family protein n=1 Tax=Herbiconiux sp. A18JL235 TaxID=3152363 RepID=A0AB39BJ46_9MICO